MALFRRCTLCTSRKSDEIGDEALGLAAEISPASAGMY